MKEKLIRVWALFSTKDKRIFYMNENEGKEVEEEEKIERIMEIRTKY